MRLRLLHVFDVREGEERSDLSGFALLLLLVITAHTILETARDALLLTGPGPRSLGIVYMVIAVCALPVGALAGRLGARIGVARALTVTLLVASVAPLVLYVVPTSRASAMALYIVSGVIASVVVPQFWTLVGSVLTVAQGRRLFGLIASAGVFGGVLGSGAAAVAIQRVPVKSLLLASAAVFAAGAFLTGARHAGRPSRASAVKRPPTDASVRAIREQPFLARVAILVALSTATVLAIDYFFKWSVVRALPPAHVAPFVARYYLALNVASLFVQVFLGSAVVHRLGVAAALIVTPLLLFGGLAASAFAGGSLLPILLAKGVDGSLRHSLHRITGELVYLPIPSGVRARAKPIIDGALVRTMQTVTSGAFLAASNAGLLSPRPFAAAVAVLAAAWLATALTLRKPYLALLRRALSSDSLAAQEARDPIDLETAELLVQHLASPEPFEVVGAMRALARRGREGFVSPLVLLHADEGVVAEALQIFSASTRTDWVPLGARLLEDPRETLRICAARALAQHGLLDAQRLTQDPAPRVRGYGAVRIALEDPVRMDASRDPGVDALLRSSGAASDSARLGMLAAIGDAPPTHRLSKLLLRLSDEIGESAEATETLARASAQQRDRSLIPKLVGLLSRRAGRDAVRAALVALGDGALDTLLRALADPAAPRSLRIHIPKTLSRFGNQKAAECLLQNIETETDRLVRYKSIRALEILAAEPAIRIARIRVERLSQENLAEHFRILGLRTALASCTASSDRDASDDASAAVRGLAAERLLLRLLDDKLRQSLERAFRLLAIAHPRQQIRRAYLACLSGDAYARANAVEFLDTLLRRRGQDRLRELLRLAADDLPLADRVGRASSLLTESMPSTREEALARLAAGEDVVVSSLAVIYASELGGEALDAVVANTLRDRPEVELGPLVRKLEPRSGESTDATPGVRKLEPRSGEGTDATPGVRKLEPRSGESTDATPGVRKLEPRSGERKKEAAGG
jgi:AAA family ATP:ADP antiporter